MMIWYLILVFNASQNIMPLNTENAKIPDPPGFFSGKDRSRGHFGHSSRSPHSISSEKIIPQLL